MRNVIAVDFGSTFTKVVVIDATDKKILLTEKVPSTVSTDASISLKECFKLAKTVISDEEFDNAVKLASSSAAGGLRMSVVGLTDLLSTLAGKSAALGAGAKIIANYSGLLTEGMVKELEESKTEIILLCGGYEHGNVSTVLKNASTLANSKITVPVIYCGNSDLDKRIRRLMISREKQCFIVENIIPEPGELNIEPTQSVIRNIFLERITDMKGLNAVKKEFQNQLVPTPLAVLSAGELLSKGTDNIKGIGPLLMLDIGGATTDVYSFNLNKNYEGAKSVGFEEPFGKRTVEGDLGMRETSIGVINEDNINSIAEELGITEEQLKNSINKRIQNIDYLPDSEIEKSIDDTIARVAAHVAVRRHAGKLVPSFNKKYKNIQLGKNLTDVPKIIGTGGILVHNYNPSEILKSVEKNSMDAGVLLPEKIEAYLDTEYVLFSAGLLKEIDEDAAIEIMIKSIKKVN